MLPTYDQAESIAPDAKSVAAAKKLVRGSSWTDLGRDDDALWGRCSGSRVYQVRCDLSDLTTNCSCPSRKFPCKHGIALVMLAAGGDVQPDTKPDWVVEWLDKRTERAAKKEERAAKAAEPVDAATMERRAKNRARTAAKRLQAISAGIDQLDLWLEDQVRAGLASWEAQGDAFFEKRARALHDAKAPGLARTVAGLAELVDGSPDWHVSGLGALGSLALQTQAWRGRDQLPADLRADLDARIGQGQKKADAVAHGERVADRWQVLGQVRRNIGDLVEQRNWLFGGRSKRFALLLDFGYGGANLPPPRQVGTRFSATLAYFTSAVPQRAVLVPDVGSDSPAADGDTDSDTSAHTTIDGFLADAAQAFARVPWMPTVPCYLAQVAPAHEPSTKRWWVRDADGHGLPLTGTPWPLIAASGGHPTCVFGEWNGTTLRLLHAEVVA